MDSIKEYNEKNQLVKETLEDGSWSTREYNDQGEVISFEDSKGYWYTREYNNQGKLVGMKTLTVFGILKNTTTKEK